MKAKFGYMKCPGCASAGRSTRVLVRKNERETLSYPCDECDGTEYAQKGSQKHADWLKVIEPIAPAAAPAAAPKPAADKSAPPKKPEQPKAKMPWMPQT